MGLWEVLTSGHARAEEARAVLATVLAGDFVHGAVELVPEQGGWMRPQRFCEGQRKALASCLAWHPGQFRQMAATTAGVCVRFATDAREVALAVRMDDEPRTTAQTLRALGQGGQRRMHDGVSCCVDGKRLGVRWPRSVARPLPWLEQFGGAGIVVFELEESQEEAPPEIMTIPGLGARHEVCLWLPCLRGCTVRELWCDGTYLEPVAARPSLLVLGDGSAQGFCADDPALAWPQAVAESEGYDLLNQSVAGQGYMPASLPAAGEVQADAVVVALGASYVREACAAGLVERDVGAYLGEVARLWPDVRTWVLTPTWHDERRAPARVGSCWEDVPEIVRFAARRAGLAVVETNRLMGRLDRRAGLLCDGMLLNARGQARMARELVKVMTKSGDKRDDKRGDKRDDKRGDARVIEGDQDG